MLAQEVEKNILDCLPYSTPFRFVDRIVEVDENSIMGNYTFKKDESFYEGHFPGNPLTPGVIITECMAQIGLVALGIFITGSTPESMKKTKVFFTSSNMNFYSMVLPGEKVTVTSTKKVFRLKKLICDVKMENESGDLVAKGELSGMFDLG